jgi:hypothetical protein
MVLAKTQPRRQRAAVTPSNHPYPTPADSVHLGEKSPLPNHPMANGMNEKQATPEPYILWPDAQPDRTAMGGKAAALASLHAHFTIPAWFVLTPAAFHASLTPAQAAQLAAGERPADLALAATVAAVVDQALDRLNPDPTARFAVRSSAVAEDGTAVSYAGQFASC